MAFKIGDRVRCKPGFNTTHETLSHMGGGSGYIDGLEFVIREITFNNVLWAYPNITNSDCGIMDHACEMVLPKPIIPWEDNVLKFKFV